MTPLIAEDNVRTLWALIVAGTALSIWLEGRYRWAAKLSAPVIALLLAMTLSNTGVMPADIRMVIFDTPNLFVLCLIMAVMNLVFTLVLGKLFRLDLEDLLLSVNATIGGPPTAAAMAVSRVWSPLVLPALLAGLWGYVLGTPLGLMVYAFLSR